MLLSILDYIFARNFLYKFNIIILKLSLRFIGYNHHKSLKKSGELYFLKEFCKKKPKICIDVGANQGIYSKFLLDNSKTKVIAFEPLSLNFTKLKKLKNKYFNRLFLYNIGLSNKKKRSKIKFNKKNLHWANFDAEINQIDYLKKNTSSEICKLDKLDELSRLIRKNKIITLVGYVLRHNLAVKKIKELFDKNIIGEILYASVECGSYLPEWRPGKNYKTSVSANKDLGGGVLLELSHELDYIRWIFGEINNIYAQIDNSGTLDINVEDSADLFINTVTNHSINVHLDFNSRFPRRQCIINGTKGYLKLDLLEQKITWHLVGDEIKNNLFNFEHDYIYQLQLEHFLDCLENGISPLVTFEDGFEVLRLVESAKKSHKIGRKVFL